MRMNSILLGLATVLVFGLIALPALAATADVGLQGSSYRPPSLTVEENTTVIWTNHDGVSHSVTSTGGLFDSGPIRQNETFSHTFTDTGTYPYGCTINASMQRIPMQGVIIVVPKGTMIEGDENATGDEAPAKMTLADLIAGDENLTTFADAIGRAGLTRTVLNAGGPYTVFAPDDAAFETLGNATFAALSNDTELLDTLLMHHIVRGNYTVEDLMEQVNVTGNETALETLTGDSLNVSVVNGTLMAGNATLVASDLVAGNGIVQIIDVVLVPPGLLLPENTTQNVTPVENVTPAQEHRVIP